MGRRRGARRPTLDERAIRVRAVERSFPNIGVLSQMVIRTALVASERARRDRGEDDRRDLRTS